MKTRFVLLLTFLLFIAIPASSKEKLKPGLLNNTKIDGFRGAWHDQLRGGEYGSKYSGGLATYTMKHRPLAIYDEKTDRTYFVYGGAPGTDHRQLLCMVSCFDHKTGLVRKPTVVYDKGSVTDPHDNPAILIDKDGFIWVYVAGRGNRRPGFKYRSVEPYNIDKFELACEPSIMAYPQPYYIEGKGHFLFETRYDGLRQLFFQTSPDGVNWSDYTQIANIREPGDTLSGQYQITGRCGEKLVSAFNRHPNGGVDHRTNIYYVQTTDFGKTWTRADGTPVNLPVVDKDDPCKIIDYEHNGQNCYIKDVNFDADGNPIILYLTSYGSKPGPEFGPREWFTAHWTGKKWDFRHITDSFHNYDSGSIYVEGRKWVVIAPFESGATKWGTGGEIVSYVSLNQGKSWKKAIQYTKDSPRNHGYVRRPEYARDPFYCFWADGNPDVVSISYLYFADSKGRVWRLPYEAQDEWIQPEPVEFQ